VSNIGSLQHSQGRQHLTQQIPDDLLALGLPPQGPPPGTGLHHGDPLQYEFVIVFYSTMSVQWCDEMTT